MADREIPTPETLRQLLRYEPESGKLFWRERPEQAFATPRAARTWNGRYAGKPAFTANDGHGYYCGAVNYRCFKAHRIAWAIYHGEWPPMHIDHLNGDRSDNRIENLRAVERVENQRNCKRHSTNTSGQMGVCWHARAGKWCAYIEDEKRIHLGLFERKADAIAARKAAEVRCLYHENHGRP